MQMTQLRKEVAWIPRGTYGLDTFAPDIVSTALSYYQDAAPAVKAMLRLAVDVACVQARAYEMLGPANAADPAEGCSAAAPPDGWLDRVLGSIVEAVVGNSPAAPQLDPLRARIGSLPFDVVLAAARGDDSALARVLGADTGDSTGDALSPAVGLYILRSALQPYLAWLYAAGPARLEASAYPARRSCPACGGSPGMGKHAKEDGLRLLRCSVCGHEWAYPRMACVACDETGSAEIEVVYAHGDQGRRLYMCRTCQRYLKISDERLLDGAVYLPLEDIATMHLDQLAKDKGYSPIAEGESDREPVPKRTE